MNIVTIIFTYNRSTHTEKVLNALQGNERLPEKLFVFQDGLKDEQHREEWEKVNQIIKKVDWCDCDVFVSEKNRGLAASIVAGLEYVFRFYEAAIVLEDDCVVHPQFMTYMIESLTKYKDKKEVYSVGGYAWPLDIKKNGTDAYFTQRISSWGWGTWKDRWVYYNRDYRMLFRIKSNPTSAKRFHNWGEDLESHLLGNIYGRYNSWAVFWALTVIERDGYCLAPYESLVDNIGFDGTGVHCGSRKTELRLRARENRKAFILPDEIRIAKEDEQAFGRYFAWVSPETKQVCYNKILACWVERLQRKEMLGEEFLKSGIKKISIWGKGQICDLLLGELSNKVEVLSIIESKPREQCYKGIPIVTIDCMPKESELIVVIPVYDMKNIITGIDDQYINRVIGINELLKNGIKNRN